MTIFGAFVAIVVAGALLGVEVWVVAVTAVGWVVTRPRITASALAGLVAVLAAAALVYVAAVTLLGVAVSP